MVPTSSPLINSSTVPLPAPASHSPSTNTVLPFHPIILPYPYMPPTAHLLNRVQPLNPALAFCPVWPLLSLPVMNLQPVPPPQRAIPPTPSSSGVKRKAQTEVPQTTVASTTKKGVITAGSSKAYVNENFFNRFYPSGTRVRYREDGLSKSGCTNGFPQNNQVQLGNTKKIWVDLSILKPDLHLGELILAENPQRPGDHLLMIIEKKVSTCLYCCLEEFKEAKVKLSTPPLHALYRIIPLKNKDLLQGLNAKKISYTTTTDSKEKITSEITVYTVPTSGN